MSFETLLKILLEEMNIPEGQKWVDISELQQKVKELDNTN